MKYLLQDIQKIEAVAKSQRGVFSISDVSILLNAEGQFLYKRLDYLKKSGILKPAVRGFYTYKEFNIQSLAARINPESYISGPTMLAEYLLIGTVPKYEINCVKTGRPREYQVEEYFIKYNSIRSSMFFGYEFVDGIKKALPEKAFLDCLYFYQSGEKYFFNIYEDINVEPLDEKRLFSFLGKYQNPKFREFVYGFYSERS
jgi:predicted transcriptional regulator of viral defense system